MTSLVCQRSRSVRKASMVCRSPTVGHWSLSGVRRAIMKQGDNEGLTVGWVVDCGVDQLLQVLGEELVA